MLTQIPIARPLIGDEEKQAVLDVLESGQLAQGAVVERFEGAFAAFCGVRHAIATSNGTTALHVALLAHGVGEGDEVITSPFTFIASANSILYAGARPVFVDIEPDTFNIDRSQIEAAITSKTKAIMPVHLYGNPVDMGAIMEIAGRHGLAVIEDAAQAHGAEVDGQRAGSFGTGSFSFYPTKNMTSGEGGMITTNDDAIADAARLIRAHGARERYRHESLGYNFRMTNIHAAIGNAQLAKIEEWTRQRQENAARLTELLGDAVVTPVTRPGARHVYHQYTVRIPGGRGDVEARLAERGIGTGVHYPIPVHRQPLYRDLGYADQLPNAEQACREVLSLPVHPSLTEDDLRRIAAETIAVVRARG
jgi:dTDP-4-amino-4,6-dideoxygalactose transaminase